jgi:iron-sulfur cluster assembly protein
MVTLSKKAAEEVRRIIGEKQMPGTTMLRIGVVGGGCSGYEYRLEFVEAADEHEDLVGECHGVKVAVDRKSARLLSDTQIDIHDGLDKRGFVFNNPLAVRTCGCGSSFQV